MMRPYRIGPGQPMPTNDVKTNRGIGGMLNLLNQDCVQNRHAYGAGGAILLIMYNPWLSGKIGRMPRRLGLTR